MDLLIIRKDKGVAITNQIGDIFRTHNIWEYKSPDDDITIDDYFKTVGYAYLYKELGKTVNEIPGDELTVSMARDVHPDKLFSVITQSGGKIEQKYPGIYHISGVVNIPTQVIVTSELDKEPGELKAEFVDETVIGKFVMERQIHAGWYSREDKNTRCAGTQLKKHRC